MPRPPSRRRTRRRKSRSPASMKPNVSFDDLVDPGEDRLRDCQPQRACGLEIDHQLESRRLLDWQIGWLGAAEDLSDVSAFLVPSAGAARSVADQGTSGDKFARRV